MVRFRHIIPASLTLSIGIAPAAASSSSPSLAGHARSALADDIARLHQSVRRARSIIEIRDADVPVSSSKLQQILGEIKSLEQQVSALLPDGAGAHGAASEGSRPVGAEDCEVGLAAHSHGKANCSTKAGAARGGARGPLPLPAAGAPSGGAGDGAPPGAAFDEIGELPTATPSRPPSLADSKYDLHGGRGGAGSPNAAAGGAAFAAGGRRPPGREEGKEFHGAPSNQADDRTSPAAVEGDGAAAANLVDAPARASAPSSLTARPAEAPQQAAITQGPAATGLARDGTRSAAAEELTTTTITRTGSSRTTIRVTRTRTRTIRVDGRTGAAMAMASQPPVEAKPAMPSPSPDDVGRYAAQDAGRVTTRAPDFSQASPDEAEEDTDRDLRGAAAQAPDFSQASPDEADRDMDQDTGGSSTPAPDFSRASSSRGSESTDRDMGRAATQVPGFSRAPPREGDRATGQDTGRVSAPGPSRGRTSSSGAGQNADHDTVAVAIRTSASSRASPVKTSRDKGQGAATRAPDFSRASPSGAGPDEDKDAAAVPSSTSASSRASIGEAGPGKGAGAGGVATRAPDFSRASPSVDAQRLAGGIRRYPISTSRLDAPLEANRAPSSDDTSAASAPTSRARVQAAPSATTPKRPMLPPAADGARTSPPAPSGFKTIATRPSRTGGTRT